MKANDENEPGVPCSLLGPILTCFVLGLATITATEAGTVPPGQAQVTLSLPPGDSPEGIAVANNSTIFFSNRRVTKDGLVSEIVRLGDDGRTSVLTAFDATDDPDANGVLGLVIRRGVVYAALDTRKEGTRGAWSVREDGQRRRLIGSKEISFPNALTFDASGHLYVTDSSGAIWRAQPEEPGDRGEFWTAHELLAPFEDFDPVPGLPLPGANGIAFVAPNQLYVANTERGLLLRILINNDGSASAPEVVAGNPLNPYTALLSIDGIAAGPSGNIHAVVPGFAILGLPSPLVRFSPRTGLVSLTVNSPLVASAFFDIPLSLAFGKTPEDNTTVYVTNGALFPGLIPGAPGPGIVQVGVLP